MIVLLFSTSQFGDSRLWASNKVDTQVLELFQGSDEGASSTGVELVTME
jgi:hypothetical protein